MRLSKDDILKAQDNAPVEVNVPEWGGTVLVRGMTGKERDAFELSMMQPGRGGRREVNPVNIRARLVARCCVGDDGERLFTDTDTAALGDKSAAAVNRIYDVAARLSGMAEGEQDDMMRDFELAGGGGSSSNSHHGSGRPSKGS